MVAPKDKLLYDMEINKDTHIKMNLSFSHVLLGLYNTFLKWTVEHFSFLLVF